MERVRAIKESCLQNEPAFCTTACPFQLGVRDFIAKLERGGFNAAFRTYLNVVGFPGIVTALCDEPCKNVCTRRETDAPISMRLLEKAAMEFARNRNPNNYNISLKGKRVAIIGAGISGLACALRLAEKKFDVTVYEQSHRIGGHLWDLLPSEIFLNDIEQQFTFENYTLHLDSKITDLSHLDFDAIYVCTGANGTAFGLSSDAGGAYASTEPGIFMGGSLTGGSSMQAIADGLRVTGAIERYLKTGSMNQPHEKKGTKLVYDTARIEQSGAVLPADGLAYTQEEALLEAKRCLKCACDACYRACDLIRSFKKYPKRIEEEVEITIHPGTLDGNGTVATRFISTCNYCGLCKEVCPQDIDTGEFLLQSHRTMREKGAMPWAFHEFWLRDMAFTNGEDAHLSRTPPGYAQSKYMFFPGCQLGGSDPRYVTDSYGWLLEHQPDTALMLHCCGAPAEWAGEVQLHGEVIQQIRTDWMNLGNPTPVFACPTCKQMFQRYLPEAGGVFLYDLIRKWGISPALAGCGETVSVFDPCSSREESKLQEAIRQLTEKAGYRLESLPMEGRNAQCCSWGGQISSTNPAYTREVIKNRVTQNNRPFVAYCANCRDIFASTQKPVYHVLDILFGIHTSDWAPPTVTERRNNRTVLKSQVLRAFWKEEIAMEREEMDNHLQITPTLRDKLSRELILETEIQAVIEHCEHKGKKVFDPESGHFFGHLQIGKITYWVEYGLVDLGYELINAYSHRMNIDEA